MTSGLTRRRYNVAGSKPQRRQMNSQPLVHAQVPAGRNRHSTRINKEAVVLMMSRRRSIGSRD